MGKLKGLKLGGLNINSLSKNIEHIRYILSQYSFYIFAINESKIDSLANDSEISIPGYRLVRTDKNRNGGGVVIYVQEHLSILVRNDLVPNNLEMICIEINQPFNRSFLVSTWYRPPNSSTDVFDAYDIFLLNCDAENKELILLGDINCDVAKSPPEAHTIRFQSINTLYNMAQLIEEPTRVARTSATIIDLILTNVPEKISHAGVIHVGISDHSLIYAVHKFKPLKRRPTIKNVRNFKHFSETEFISDLTNIPWQTIFTTSDPNLSWNKWKELFIGTLDKHAPVRHIRSGKYTTPWMTAEIRSAMRRRDYHKKKAIKLKSDSHWHNYKRLRNKVNKLIHETKSIFYINKISECADTKDLKKCWSTINSLL